MFVGSAFAEGYVGGAIGRGHTNLDCGGASTCSTKSTGYKVFGGFKFAPNLAGELTYFDFGKARAADPGLSLDLKTTALGVGVAFGGDFAASWSGLVRVGVASVRVKADATLNGVTGSLTESNTAAYAGLGIAYQISNAMFLTGGVDFSRAKITGQSANVRLLSAGLTFRF